MYCRARPLPRSMISLLEFFGVQYDLPIFDMWLSHGLVYIYTGSSIVQVIVLHPGSGVYIGHTDGRNVKLCTLCWQLGLISNRTSLKGQ